MSEETAHDRRHRKTGYSPIGLKFESQSETSLDTQAVQSVELKSATPTDPRPDVPTGGTLYVVENANVTGCDELGTQHGDDLYPYTFLYVVVGPPIENSEHGKGSGK